jgi:MFS family permease
MPTAHNPKRLFLASCLTMIVLGMVFAIRGDTIDALRTEFSLTNEQLGWISGAAFWGFLASILVGGQLCDLLGMGRLLGLAFLGHTGGVLLTIFASGFWTLWIATLAIGLANGFVEASINPLIATAYPDRKTQRLNALHAWFPGGIVIGGLAAYLLTFMRIGWQTKTALILLPTLAYGLMYLGQKFPATERVQSGVSTGAMYRELLRPSFLFLAVCMLLTASTELGPNQWIPAILTNTAGMQGILVLVWINGLMALGRLVAGPLMHRLSSLGVLNVAAILAAIGLFALSFATTPAVALAAATVFAFGITYFWPTMLGLTSERFPSGGAVALAIMGGAGNLSVAITLPLIGRIYDVKGPQLALRYVTILPLLLIGAFAIMRLMDRARGGHHAVMQEAQSRMSGGTK